MARYVILIARAGGNYAAHVPDVPGVIATGDTVEEVIREMREALAFHLEGLALEGEPIPAPELTAAYVDVDMPSPSSPAPTAAPKP